MGDMTTKPQKLDKRTGIAVAINEAANWLSLALRTQDRADQREQMLTALRWLEKTGVTEIEPPSIDQIRFK